MRLFYRRPLAIVCAAFLVSSVIYFYFGHTVHLTAAIIYIAVALCAVFLLFIIRNGKKVSALILCIALSALSGLFVSHMYISSYFAPLQKNTGNNVDISATVIERRYTNAYSSGYKIRVNSLNGNKCNFKAMLDCEYTGDLQVGYSFDMNAMCRDIGYNARYDTAKANALSEGYKLKFISDDESKCDITAENVSDIGISISEFNRKLSSKVRRTVGGEEGNLIAALALGNKSYLADETVRDFSRAGVSHLLALSGLHMTVVMAVLDFIFKKMYMKKSLRCGFLITGMILYLTVTGFSVSACRAAIMLSLIYISYFISAQSDSMTSLFIAGTVIVLFSPAAVLDVGFLLSFCATFGIIAGVPVAESTLEWLYTKDGKRRKVMKNRAYKIFVKGLRYLVIGIGTTVSATVATSIIVWIVFGRISLWTPLTNILLSPLTAILLFFSVLLILFIYISPVASFMSAAAGAVSKAILSVTGYFSDFDGSVISLKYKFAGIIIICLVVTMSFLAVINIKKKWICILPVPVAVIAFSVCLSFYNFGNANNLKTVYINAGKSDMIVASNRGKAFVCDISTGGYSNVLSALDTASDNYATDISVFMLTHYHQRHIPTVYRLLTTEHVCKLLLPYPQNEKEYNIMWSIVYYAQRYNCEIGVYKNDENIDVLGVARLRSLKDYIKRSTHPVMALNICCGAKEITFVGTSVHESALYGKVCGYTSCSDYILFGSAGPVTKTNYSYPVNEKIKEIVFTDNKIMSYFDYSAETENLLKEAIIISSPEKSIIDIVS